METELTISCLVGEITNAIHSFWEGPLENKQEFSGTIIAFPCDFLPFEILSAHGITPLIVPNFLNKDCSPGFPSQIENTADVYAFPAQCRHFKDCLPGVKTLPVENIPPEPGEPSIGAWKSTLASFLKNVKNASISSIPDPTALRKAAEMYNTLRRVIRGIAALRAEKPKSMAQSQLFTIFQGGLSLPFEVVYPFLTGILEALLNAPTDRPPFGLPTMISGCCASGHDILDALEALGFYILEDDICGGRRSFDLSHNTESAELHEEIIRAFSFRPLCPCLRSPRDRFELLYRLAGSYGIETIIMFDEGKCHARQSHIAETRVRLMRNGIDPLVLTDYNAIEEAQSYIRNASV